MHCFVYRIANVMSIMSVQCISQASNGKQHFVCISVISFMKPVVSAPLLCKQTIKLPKDSVFPLTCLLIRPHTNARTHTRTAMHSYRTSTEVSDADGAEVVVGGRMYDLAQYCHLE